MEYEYEMQRMKKLWIAFYISGVLITLRSIYRTIGESPVLDCKKASSHFMT